MTPISNLKKALVINANSWYNKGDTSNRFGLIISLKREFGTELSISIETVTPKEDRLFFGKLGVNIVESLFSNSDKPRGSFIHRFITNLSNVFVFIVWLFLYRILGIAPNKSHKSKVFLLELIESDFIISAPGGFLQDYNIISTLLPNMFTLISAELLNKPVVVYAQSIGPFKNKILRFVCAYFLNKTQVITLRENISKSYLTEYKITQPAIYVTADSTFSLEPPEYDRTSYRRMLKSPQSNSSLLIGLTIIGDYFLSRDRNHLLAKYITSYVSVIDYLISEYDATVIFVPQVVSASEIEIMNKIVQSVKKPDQTFIIHDDFSPQEVMKIIGSMDFFIGTRMHSNIFATIMNVPLIAIAYEHKTVGIMKMLNLEEWVVDITDINERQMVELINELYQNRLQIKTKMASAVKKLAEESKTNASIVKEWYRKNL